MKKIGALLVFLLLGLLLWFLFLKPYDYLVTFKANTSPGVVKQSIKTWSATLPDADLLYQKGLEQIDQEISYNDSTSLYKWRIRPFNDSMSKVKVYVKDLDHSFKNKIAILFGETDFEKRTKKTVIDLNDRLKQHLLNFKVSIEGEKEFEATYCAYVPLKSSQIAKAQGMMQNYTLLSTYLFQNDIELNGRPFVEVTHWDLETDSLRYNFCYPIKKNDSLKDHEIIKYKQIEATRALKAIYNGNYITSDRAWYALLDHAAKEKLKVLKQPIEVFYNNPNMGGNELNWRAEIFMPIE